MDEKMQNELTKQTYWMRLTALFMCGIFLVAFLSAVTLVPKANSIMTDAKQTLEEVNSAVSELNKTATQLSEIDFKGLVSDTQHLVSDTQLMVNDGSAGITQAIGKLNEIDIEGLNNAIANLEAVVAPLARLFGKK